MGAGSDAVLAVGAATRPIELEAVFHEHYARLARVIARVIRDPARAEELAVEVFLRWSRSPRAHGEVVGVSLDEDGWAAVGPYLDERGINYPIVLAVDRLEHQYPDVTALPTTLIVDRAGRVAARHVGLVERSAYEAEIEAALRLR